MSKILLVDTNFSSAPIYEKLHEMGHEVHVVGGNKNDCLAKAVPHYWNINYADTAALENILIEQRYEYIVPGCTDKSYESCVAISRGKYPGLDNPLAEKTLNNKVLFRHLANQLNLPVPKTQDLNLTSLRWPLIVKPANAFSGKGITVLKTEDRYELEAAIQTACAASTNGEYLIEDFVDGDLFSHSAFLMNGEVIQDFIVQENSTANPFVVDTSRVLRSPAPALLSGLRDCVENLGIALKLQNGLVHTQFICKDEKFWLIEITRRCPGDLYSQLIQLSTGFDYVEAYVKPFLGLPLNESPRVSQHQFIMRHTLTLTESQNLGFVHFKQPLLIERWIPLSLVGDQLKPSPLSRIGILFSRSVTQEEFDSTYKSALQRELYEIQR